MSNQAVCEGRFTLGLGPSHHWIVDRHARASVRPARAPGAQLPRGAERRVRGPGPVDVENDDFRVHNPLDVTDIAPTPILLAALAPVMLRIAGELASGTILWMADERAIGEHVVPRITKAAAGGGPARAARRRRRAGRAVRQRRGRRARARGRTRRSGTPSTRRTTSACSSTATRPTSATSSPAGDEAAVVERLAQLPRRGRHRPRGARAAARRRPRPRASSRATARSAFLVVARARSSERPSDASDQAS